MIQSSESCLSYLRYNYSTKGLLVNFDLRRIKDWTSLRSSTRKGSQDVTIISKPNIYCSRRLIKSDEMGFFAYTFSLILIYFTKYSYSSQILFSLLLSISSCRCLSQHKLKFWTGIRLKIKCGMVLVGMD